MPKWEPPREFESFWFIALFNVFVSIANSISLTRHGGMLILSETASKNNLRIKYAGEFNALRSSFVDFINTRNVVADFYERAEQRGQPVSKAVHKAELAALRATDAMVEAIRFVARLSSCDGAIVLTPDLKLVGFGAEIRAELKEGAKVGEVIDEPNRHYLECDLEQFGMRHRSAIKLASQDDKALVLAISQDGPISAVWSDKGSVLVKKGAQLTNMNMPYAGGV